MVPSCDHPRFGIRGENVQSGDLRIRGEWSLPKQATIIILKAMLKITLLSHSEMYQLRTRSIKEMLLVMYLRMWQFHHLQHPDLDLKDERIKSELTGKLADAPSVILLQTTTFSHTFPKTQTATFVAETNQPELLVGHQRPQEVMLSRNPKHSETLSPPITRF